MLPPATVVLTEFATAVASRLPGRWQADEHPTPLTADPASDRLWDTGPLPYAAFPHAGAHRSVLTSAAGLQLYITQHPNRRAQFVVATMLPAGTSHAHTHGITSPRGIVTGADPVRATSKIRRRQLFALRVASMRAQTNATQGPHLPVHIAFAPDGRPRVTTVYVRALHELLAREDFRLDPASGQCHLPDTIPTEEAVQRTHQVARRLTGLGFRPTFSAEGANTRSCSGTSRRPAPSAPPTGRAPGHAR